MIRRALVLFALFTLTLVSAATAHEHGMLDPMLLTGGDPMAAMPGMAS